VEESFLDFSGHFETFRINHPADKLNEPIENVSGYLWQSQYAPKPNKYSNPAEKSILEP